MPLKNYTTKAPVSSMLNEIQKSLIRVGAIGMNYKFDQQGRITGLSFGLSIKDNPVGFTLPINTEKVKLVLKKDGIRRWDDEDYVYRVSWACMRDWVTAQLAMIESEMVEPLQVFLPYAQDRSGKTLYEKLLTNNLLLE